LAWVLVLTLLVLAQTHPTQAQIPLRLWHSWEGDAGSLLERWVAGYQARTPNIIIQSERMPLHALRERFISTPNAERPDILIGPSDWAGDLFANAFIAPLDARLGAAFRAQLLPVAWDTTTFESKTLGLPLALEGLVLYYNRALVPADSVVQTWDDLVRQMQVTIAAGDGIDLTIGEGFYATAGIYLSYGGQLLDDRGRNLMTSETILSRYLTRVQALYALRGPSVQIGGAGVDFRLGQARYALDGTWQFWENRAMLGQDFGVAALPSVEGQPWRPLVRSTLLMISASSRQIEPALSFGRYVTSAEAQSDAARIALLVPVNRQATIEDAALAVAASSLQRDGVAIPTHPKLRDYWRGLDAAIRRVGLHAEAPRAVARDVIAAFVAP
jgi:maltose-binding protein MalE